MIFEPLRVDEKGKILNEIDDESIWNEFEPTQEGAVNIISSSKPCFYIQMEKPDPEEQQANTLANMTQNYFSKALENSMIKP